MTVGSISRDCVGELLYLLRLTNPRRRGRGKLNVVTFHRVLPGELRAQYPLPGLCVTPHELRWYLEFFRESFSCGSLRDCAQQLKSRETMSKPLLALTFDDAQEDNFRYAQEVLDACDMKATFFVPTHNVETGEPLWHDRVGFALLRIGRAHQEGAQVLLKKLDPAFGSLEVFSEIDLNTVRKVMASLKSLPDAERLTWLSTLEELVGGCEVPSWARMMSWEQIQELDRIGHEVGSHSVHHPILPNCDLNQIEDEVCLSKNVLEEKLGKGVESFCYPNGDWDGRVVKAVRKAGYQRAVTTQWGRNARDANAYTLRRFDICTEHVLSGGGQLSAARLAWRISGLYPGLGS
jgi:peptidoglycan/xylan/chitin deacetylase (PgdA/CDA1 family)